jgi:hypothetical protein
MSRPYFYDLRKSCGSFAKFIAIRLASSLVRASFTTKHARLASTVQGRREAALGHLSRRCAVIHRCSQGKRGDLFPRMKGLVSFRRLAHISSGFGNDGTCHSYPCGRNRDRAVTGLCLARLHDGKRDTRQILPGASYLARHRTLLEIRGRARALATISTRGTARAFPTSRTRRERASAFPATRDR